MQIVQQSKIDKLCTGLFIEEQRSFCSIQNYFFSFLNYLNKVMNNMLIFGHSKIVKCCNYFSDEILLLVDEHQIHAFQFETQKIISSEDVSDAISIHVFKDKTISVQQKMGGVIVFEFEFPHIKKKGSFQTNTYGFLQILPFWFQEKPHLWAINTQDQPSIDLIDVTKGERIKQFVILDDENGKGITSFDFNQNENEFIFYLGQEGCNLHQFSLKLNSDNAENVNSLKIPTSQQVKIIMDICNLQTARNTQYVVVRNQPYLFVIKDMQIQEKIEFQGGLRFVKMSEKGIVISEKGKIIGLNKKIYGQAKYDKVVDVKVSGNIVTGATQNQSFFYLQL